MPTLKWIQNKIDHLGFRHIKVKIDKACHIVVDHDAIEAYADCTLNTIWISTKVLTADEDVIVVLMTHEIGHIENGHWAEDMDEVHKQWEFEADEVSKYLLREQGWTEERIDKAFLLSMSLTQDEWDNTYMVKIGKYPTWQETLDHWKNI